MRETGARTATLIDMLPLAESGLDNDRRLALRAARDVWKISSNSSPAMEIASSLAEDDQAMWRVDIDELLSAPIQLRRPKRATGFELARWLRNNTVRKITLEVCAIQVAV